jgi:hypothetical protein
MYRRSPSFRAVTANIEHAATGHPCRSNRIEQPAIVIQWTVDAPTYRRVNVYVSGFFEAVGHLIAARLGVTAFPEQHQARARSLCIKSGGEARTGTSTFAESCPCR